MKWVKKEAGWYSRKIIWAEGGTSTKHKGGNIFKEEKGQCGCMEVREDNNRDEDSAHVGLQGH